MLGASVYLSEDLSKIKDYLTKISKYGIKEIFTSIHISEEDPEGTLEKLNSVSSHIDELGMSLMIDISSATLTRYNMSFDELLNYLKIIKIKKLRVDYGFSDEEIVEISKNFDVILNASTIDDTECKKLESLGLNLNNIIACHNFYPRPETGLGEKSFLEQNKYLKSKGFKIQAFLPGDDELRGPIYEGLPTIETHRHKDPLFTFIDLHKKYYIDEILIGDISIKESSFERLRKYIEEGIISLRVENMNINDPRIEDLILKTHTNRKDLSDYVIRSAEARFIVDYDIEANNTSERAKGSITIDNKNYGRYNGELQITKRDLARDEKVNVLGNVIEEDLPLLEYILAGDKYKFIDVNKI